MAVDGTTTPAKVITGASNKINIHEAAGGGGLGDVKTYLKDGGLIDKRDADRWTPLMMAAREGHLEVAKILLRSGASLEARDGDKWTAMHVAAANGHPQCCQLLLDRGANPRVVDENKRTPLHWATRYGYAAVVELLLKRGADAKSKDADGKTPGDVVGEDLSEDSRAIIQALFLEHAKKAKTGSRQRRGSCPNIAPTVSIATLDTPTSSSSVASAAAATTPPEGRTITPSNNGGNKDPTEQAHLPLPSLAAPTRGAVGGGGAIDGGGNILSGPCGENDATNSGAEMSTEKKVAGVFTAADAGDVGAGGGLPAGKRRAQQRRGSYSTAVHIRGHLPTHQHQAITSTLPTSSASSGPLLAAAAAVEAGGESQAVCSLLPSPIQGRKPRESAHACETDGTNSSRARVDERDDGDVVGALRRALNLAEERALEAETLRAKEEISRLREETRAKTLEERVVELEKLLAAQN